MSAAVWEPRRHPVAAAAEELHTVLDQVAEASVWSMTHAELTGTLTGLTRLIARARELELRVAAHAHRRGVGDSVGATSAAVWWSQQTRLTRAEAHRWMRLADALEGRHEPVRDALAAGEVLPTRRGSSSRPSTHCPRTWPTPTWSTPRGST